MARQRGSEPEKTYRAYEMTYLPLLLLSLYSLTRGPHTSALSSTSSHGWEPGTSSFISHLQHLDGSQAPPARHPSMAAEQPRTTSKAPRAKSMEEFLWQRGAGGSQPRVEARLSGGVLRLRWKTPLRPWIGAEMWIGGRGGSLQHQRRRRSGESCCVC